MQTLNVRSAMLAISRLIRDAVQFVRGQAGSGRGMVQRLGEEGVNTLAGHEASR